MTKPTHEYEPISRRKFIQSGGRALAGMTLGMGFLGKIGLMTNDANAATLHATPDRRGVMTLKDSMALAGQNLLNVLSPQRNYLPMWVLKVERDYKAGYDFWWPGHNIGRWWDALLRLERTIGFEIPKPVEKAMLENTRQFFDNPLHICLNPDKSMKEWNTDFHSLREGLLGLNDLARWRKNEWAADEGKRMVRSLNGMIAADGTWPGYNSTEWDKIPQNSHGRLIEALVWFYETTGDEATLALADRLSRFHFEKSTQPGGGLNRATNPNHAHSYFGTLRGLFLYGKLTRQRQYIERVAETYNATVSKMVKESGYTDHNIEPAQGNFGETTSPGDAAQLALWLTLEGYSEYLDDAERLVRVRILPSQILSTPPLTPRGPVDKDEFKELERKIIGAYGGCHHEPHADKQGTTDVTAADVHTLADIYAHIAVSTPEQLQIFFHLDFEDDRVQIRSRRTEAAEVTIKPKRRGPVAVRVPKWAPRESVRFEMQGKPVEPVMTGHFAALPICEANETIVMKYALPTRETREKSLGQEQTLYWKGDEVMGCSPNSNFYPFYPNA